MALINPEIEPATREMVEDWEGCLSIPDIRGRVPRARQIVVRAYDRSGKKIEIQASGFTARVIQHETDHLDGVLFFDRMTSFQSLTFLDEFGASGAGRQDVEDRCQNRSRDRRRTRDRARDRAGVGGRRRHGGGGGAHGRRDRADGRGDPGAGRRGDRARDGRHRAGVRRARRCGRCGIAAARSTCW